MPEPDPFRFFPYQAIVDRPAMRWPNGARVAVWVIPNIEHFHWEIGNGAPDVRNHSRRDYGNRVGVRRRTSAIFPAATTATGWASGA
jgi:hypothetical protein